MRDIQTGEVIGTVECPGCGAQTPLKVNAHKNIYFFCAKRLDTTDPRTGKREICLTRMNYGRTGSKKIIEKFLATEEATQDVQHEIGKTTEQHTAAEHGHDAERVGEFVPVTTGGFAAGLKRFLTE